MLVKEEGCKVNFIDENDVFVGYDLEHWCCEHAFYQLTYDRSDALEDEGVGSFSPEILEGYVFDVDYFKDDLGEGETYGVQFRLVKDNEKNIYINLVNSHNGYYSHGFTATVKGEIWESGQI